MATLVLGITLGYHIFTDQKVDSFEDDSFLLFTMICTKFRTFKHILSNVDFNTKFPAILGEILTYGSPSIAACRLTKNPFFRHQITTSNLTILSISVKM